MPLGRPHWPRRLPLFRVDCDRHFLFVGEFPTQLTDPVGDDHRPAGEPCYSPEYFGSVSGSVHVVLVRRDLHDGGHVDPGVVRSMGPSHDEIQEQKLIRFLLRDSSTALRLFEQALKILVGPQVRTLQDPGVPDPQLLAQDAPDVRGGLGLVVSAEATVETPVGPSEFRSGFLTEFREFRPNEVVPKN